VHTPRTIGMIIGGLLVAGVGTCITAAVIVGWATATIVAIALVVAAAVTVRVSRPWYLTWGASQSERTAAIAGDQLLGDAAQTTRAIGIHQPLGEVWPWLAQIGWGRAGWYSYDRIDNDGRGSATAIHREWQQLAAGDVIAMTPSIGFTVRDVEPAATIVSQGPEGATWCVQLTADGDRCRPVSRFWIPGHPPGSFAAAAWSLLADPGSFVMERRMLLLGIKQRAERHQQPDAASAVR
jgi:hypothetical protein